ncbi:hypothetical protein QR685DRAFT_511434 [Neurospora intermedia]|uniref:Uncharacterized protein n=1 Tax=Neurospora intermedia TaxID=5142 RepID=A0ABR3DQT1_NEUIN
MYARFTAAARHMPYGRGKQTLKITTTTTTTVPAFYSRVRVEEPWRPDPEGTHHPRDRKQPSRRPSGSQVAVTLPRADTYRRPNPSETFRDFSEMVSAGVQTKRTLTSGYTVESMTLSDAAMCKQTRIMLTMSRLNASSRIKGVDGQRVWSQIHQ